MINVSNALLIVRPVVKVYGDSHGMFATALVTRNVNRILRHENSFPSLFATVGECQLKFERESNGRRRIYSLSRDLSSN